MYFKNNWDQCEYLGSLAVPVAGADEKHFDLYHCTRTGKGGQFVIRYGDLPSQIAGFTPKGASESNHANIPLRVAAKTAFMLAVDFKLIERQETFSTLYTQVEES